MKRITSRFVLLIATAAVLPLLVYGLISINSLRSGTGTSVREGNLKVASQVAEQIGMYMRHNTRVLQSLGAELGSTGLTTWQQERILKDLVLQFPEFREITVFDGRGAPVATSAIRKTRLQVPEAAQDRQDVPYVAPVQVDDDILPTSTIAVRLPTTREDLSWVVGEISVEELWRMVDRIHVGERGFALLVGQDGRLIAHGNPDQKRHIADSDQAHAAAQLRFAAQFRQTKQAYEQYVDEDTREQMLAVAAAVGDPVPLWTVDRRAATGRGPRDRHQHRAPAVRRDSARADSAPSSSAICGAAASSSASSR